MAWLEIIERCKEAPEPQLREALGHLERVVSTLVKLVRTRAR